jgi:hypothetical protein
MKKFFVLFMALALTVAVTNAASAQKSLKDVPTDHWAASAVYDVVQMGVVQGYPDGTFRGNRNITRYEAAVMISKLAKYIGSDAIKADIAELKREVAALKVTPMKEEGGVTLSGTLLADWRTGNVFTQKGSVRGAVADYRLMMTAANQINSTADIKVNLDTMDYGFMDDNTTMTGGILAQQLIDIEANISLSDVMSSMGMENPVNLKLTYGPGDKVHAADPTRSFPGDVGVTYVRPNPSVMVATSMSGVELSGGYISLRPVSSGRIQTSQLTGSVGYNFDQVPMVNSVKVVGTADYLSVGQFATNEDERDIRGSVAVSSSITDKIEASGIWRLGGSDKKNWAVSGDLTLNDVWDTGTVAIVRASKVGVDFVTDLFAYDEFDFAGFDTFDRYLIEGTVNIGGEVTQAVTDNIKLIGKGDIRLRGDFEYDDPLGRYTAEGGIAYSIAPNATLGAKYRVNQDQSTDDTTDMAAIGLMYNF